MNHRLNTMEEKKRVRKKKRYISGMFPKSGFKEYLGFYSPEIMGGKTGRNGGKDITRR